MNVTDAIDAAISAFVTKPAKVLPFYLLGTGVGAVARTLPMIAAAIALLSLHARSNLAEFRETLMGIDWDELVEFQEEFGDQPGAEPGFDPGTQDPGVDPDEAPIEEFEALGEAFALLVTPEGVLLLTTSILAAVAVWVVLDAAVAAGQIHAVYGTLRERPALTDGVSGLFRDAVPFVGVRLIEILLYLLLTGTIGSIVVIVAVVDPGLGVVVGVLAFPVWALSMLVVLAVFLFTPQTIVVDEERTFGAIRRSAGFIVDRPIDFLAYVVIAIAVIAAALSASGAFAFLGSERVPALVFLLVWPALDLIKTAIYADEEDVVVPGFADRDTEGIVARVKAGTRRSLGELWSFTKATPGLFVASMGLFLGGMAAGIAAIGDVRIDIPAPTDPAEVFGVFPVDMFVEIAINNWLVAVAQSFGGFVLGIPTAASLVFNGFIVGVVGGIAADPMVTAALIVPHALLEVPALAISGALGLYLGVVGWRRARGRIDDEAVGEEIERAFWVLVGLAFVLIAAAFIEAFITPWVGVYAV